MGSQIPEGLVPLGCTEGHWMQWWTKLADEWTLGMGRVDHADANLGDW